MFDLTPYDHTHSTMDKFFGDMARSFFGDWGNNMLSFKTDVLDKGDKFVLEAELPGFEKEDITLDINGDCLTVKAERRAEKEEKDEKGYIRRERSYGAYARSFDVSGIKTDEIKARYQNGILELDLPKLSPTPEPNAKRSIAIE